MAKMDYFHHFLFEGTPNLFLAQDVLDHLPTSVLRARGGEGAAEEVQDLLFPGSSTEHGQPWPVRGAGH